MEVDFSFDAVRTPTRCSDDFFLGFLKKIIGTLQTDEVERRLNPSAASSSPHPKSKHTQAGALYFRKQATLPQSVKLQTRQDCDIYTRRQVSPLLYA